MTEMNEHRLDDPGRDDAVVTRSEEQLRIYTRRRETRRARLVKDVEVETQTRTVEVRHERVRVEIKPIVEGDSGRSPSTAGSAAGGEGWLVLYDEEVVVQTRWVPRERVRLTTRTVTEDREISEDLRSERIELDEPTHGG